MTMMRFSNTRGNESLNLDMSSYQVQSFLSHSSAPCTYVSVHDIYILHDTDALKKELQFIYFILETILKQIMCYTMISSSTITHTPKKLY